MFISLWQVAAIWQNLKFNGNIAEKFRFLFFEEEWRSPIFDVPDSSEVLIIPIFHGNSKTPEIGYKNSQLLKNSKQTDSQSSKSRGISIVFGAETQA